MQKLILVTNDDGIFSPGIRLLSSIAKSYGKVMVIAPDKPQSGMGHAITINSTLRIEKTNYHQTEWEYACSGTPVDCVKMGINHFLKQKPDLVLSGVNHGSNSSINVIYSGTMSAALEGALEGSPSIGFSMCNYSIEARLEQYKELIQKIIELSFTYPMPKGTCWNVNIPDIPAEIIKGLRFVRQARAHWVEKFDERKDPYGRSYFWLTGNFVNFEPESTDTDEWALQNGYVSIVPTQADLTDNYSLELLKKLNHEG
jgi:5'-nucleotidase